MESLDRIERYYLVKTVTKATEYNEFSKGAVHTHVFGKNCEMLFAETGDPWIDRDYMTPYYIRNYGYKRECDARRSFAYKNPERSIYWTERPEIIAVDIKTVDGVSFIA